jgi:hypothetical protein
MTLRKRLVIESRITHVYEKGGILLPEPGAILQKRT